jgi:beta-galactosidase
VQLASAPIVNGVVSGTAILLDVVSDTRVWPGQSPAQPGKSHESGKSWSPATLPLTTLNGVIGERAPGVIGERAVPGQFPAPLPSRRAILRAGALAGVAAVCSTGLAAAGTTGLSAQGTYDFNRGWLFGGRYVAGSADRGHDDSGFARVTLPHTVTPLSWGNWDPASWEAVWVYRKHFATPRLPGGGRGRVFVDFDGVMVNATMLVNGTAVSTHQGGYLPWPTELTGHLRGDDNVLALIVDSRWLQVPPEGAPGGALTVDYLQPGGIYRDATLRVVPEVFLSDVFVKPVNVLSRDRSVQVQATIDAAAVPRGPVRLSAELRDGSGVVATASASVAITDTGTTLVTFGITRIGDVTLWSPDTPKLYTVVVTLAPAGRPAHTVTVSTGFREAVFKLDGFYLNGSRFKIFGLNRHQLFPYIGMAAPARLQRRDAEILKYELNCNMVRCSHYPQSPHFLDACDELGLMVWQEPPGWGYVGEAAWQAIMLQNVQDMVIRDRSRPSVIVWATRPNECANHPVLYAQARELAYQLDGSRQTSGSMDSYSMDGWAEDVFAYDDYQRHDGNAVLEPPMPGVPYLVSEAVGALDGSPTYRWTNSGAVLAEQALMHAQVHNTAQSDPRYAGLLGWSGIDYASLHGGRRIWDGLKTPGVIDTFRVAKPGAAFYRSQRDPSVDPVILPVFFWDFGPDSPLGPGPDAMIATNCDVLEIFVDGYHVATGSPDTTRFGSLAHPPVFADLLVDGSDRPELRIDGYFRGQLATSVRMSADTRRDRLELTAEDASILANGTDATRLTFRAVDAYGNQRPSATGLVHLSMAGPATLIGDNPFDFGAYGGVGGAFLRSKPGEAGPVSVTAHHRALGWATVQITAATVS